MNKIMIVTVMLALAFAANPESFIQWQLEEQVQIGFIHTDCEQESHLCMERGGSADSCKV